jgi:hypothetical protein
LASAGARTIAPKNPFLRLWPILTIPNMTNPIFVLTFIKQLIFVLLWDSRVEMHYQFFVDDVICRKDKPAAVGLAAQVPAPNSGLDLDGLTAIDSSDTDEESESASSNVTVRWFFLMTFLWVFLLWRRNFCVQSVPLCVSVYFTSNGTCQNMLAITEEVENAKILLQPPGTVIFTLFWFFWLSLPI